MSENPQHVARPVPTPDQLARAQEVLVRELTALRGHALARRVDAAQVEQVFRHRARRLACVTGSTWWEAGEPDAGEYSVWW
jgi:hypothetical protein